MTFKKSMVTHQQGGDTGNWNIAGYYALNKIGLPSIKLDEYEEVARRGTTDLIEEFTIDEQIRTLARIKALEKMGQTLLMLISNTRFAVKKDKREMLDNYKITIGRILNLIPTIKLRTINQRDKSENFKINEEKFDKLLKLLIDIKEELNEPLNEASLIFTNIEESDIDKMKEDYINQLLKSG